MTQSADQFYGNNRKEWHATLGAIGVRYFDAALSFAEAYARSQLAELERKNAELQNERDLLQALKESAEESFYKAEKRIQELTEQLKEKE